MLGTIVYLYIHIPESYFPDEFTFNHDIIPLSAFFFGQSLFRFILGCLLLLVTVFCFHGMHFPVFSFIFVAEICFLQEANRFFNHSAILYLLIGESRHFTFMISIAK